MFARVESLRCDISAVWPYDSFAYRINFNLREIFLIAERFEDRAS